MSTHHRFSRREYASGGRIKRSEYGYDGDLCYPERRVTVCPDALWKASYILSLEAKGILLEVFYKYWSKSVSPNADVIRLSHRPLSKKRFATFIDELERADLVVIRGGRIEPRGPFGPNPEAASAPRLSARDMPSDWADLRETVFLRDGYSCVYCGSGRDLHCDHVHPVALGGGHETSNLVTACANCNLSKGSKTVAEWSPDIAKAMNR
jgi:hypothetical protein